MQCLIFSWKWHPASYLSSQNDFFFSSAKKIPKNCMYFFWGIWYCAFLFCTMVFTVYCRSVLCWMLYVVGFFYALSYMFWINIVLCTYTVYVFNVLCIVVYYFKMYSVNISREAFFIVDGYHVVNCTVWVCNVLYIIHFGSLTWRLLCTFGVHWVVHTMDILFGVLCMFGMFQMFFIVHCESVIHQAGI